jgi:uncharacterized membrane protein
VGLLSIFHKRKHLIHPADEEQVVASIRAAEKNTSGEVRVFVESRCRFVDPVDRAAEIFFGLKMEMTKQRNAVLIYVAVKDRQLAVFGDEGIHKIVGTAFWEDEVKNMLGNFKKEDFVTGLCSTVTDIGHVLKEKFPYQRDDKNELPDKIVFGK